MMSRGLGLAVLSLLSSPAWAETGDEPRGATAAATTADGAALPEEEELPRTRLGIGVGVNLSSGASTGISARLPSVSEVGGITELSASIPSITFFSLQAPIWIGEHLRIEPEIGFGRASRTLDFIQEAGFDSSKLSASSLGFLLGTSVAWAFDVAPSTRAYVGPRIGVILRRDELEIRADGAPQTVTLTATDLFLGGLIGGESFLTSHFSLGVEGELVWVSEGSPKVTVKPGIEASVLPVRIDDSHLATTARFVARLYFF